MNNFTLIFIKRFSEMQHFKKEINLSKRKLSIKVVKTLCDTQLFIFKSGLLSTGGINFRGELNNGSSRFGGLPQQ